MPPKKKKKKTIVLVGPEDDMYCEDVDAEKEVPVAPETEEPVEPVEEPVEPVAEEPVVEKPCCPDSCPKCGLPKADFYKRYTNLRPDLRSATKRRHCPKCMEPSAPY